ncbi:hypothetical protein M404DRAFT_903570 [Pisolithus tinctorius Marx 270]|uniref:Uncharacterized protein n=1 Tax=Pisolithus tinctorius Marx 270 TaxID=870435 RepID=A0A0C3JMG4_PISTI|nr:hypothetical protein M404DRAFT_903570 [Pisolithus tinctorius Marx 270]
MDKLISEKVCDDKNHQPKYTHRSRLVIRISLIDRSNWVSVGVVQVQRSAPKTAYWPPCAKWPMFPRAHVTRGNFGSRHSLAVRIELKQTRLRTHLALFRAFLPLLKNPS